MWEYMPDPVLLHIFSYLKAKDLLAVQQVCKAWNNVANDEFLWKFEFCNKWKLLSSIAKPHESLSWQNEYKRLHYHVPVVETEVLTAHTDQVLHVSFAHSGEYFASSSKDGFIKVWTATYPAEVKYSADMKIYKWNYTQFSQFNASDTLLLVSGVHSGIHTASGEIAVFNFEDDFSLQCRVINKPYDIFGTWYTDNYLLSGQLFFLGQLLSCSTVWLNKASQETESENKPVVKRMFRFYNQNASTIRTILVANCLFPEDTEESPDQDRDCPVDCSPSIRGRKGNPISSPHLPVNMPVHYGCTRSSNVAAGPSGFVWYQKNEKETSPSVAGCSASDTETEEISEYLDPNEKLLIFTTGALSYTPHQIGIKRIKPFKFPEVSEPLNLSERLAARQDQNQQETPVFDPSNQENINQLFDKVDHIIDLHGHIIGMGLSPDHRYLYVNSRTWPENYVVENPLQPPPIAQEIDIHVIDLVTLQKVGPVLRSHKAFTPGEECFFIFLDVSNLYVASGAEDKNGYLWDRYYGTCLGKLPHADVVNSVAFNPKDPEMLITASDDVSLKIWRSHNRVQELGIETSSSS